MSLVKLIKNSWNISTSDSVGEEGDLFANPAIYDEKAKEMIKRFISNGHIFDKF